MTGEPTPRRRWFPDTRLNHAGHVLRHETTGDPARPMLHNCPETRAAAVVSLAEVAGALRKMASRMRAMGLGPGARGLTCMPNIPETVIAARAITAIGRARVRRADGDRPLLPDRPRRGRCLVLLFHNRPDGIEHTDVGATHEWPRGCPRRPPEPSRRWPALAYRRLDPFDLAALVPVMRVGSPSAAETFDWVYDAVKPDVWASAIGWHGGLPRHPRRLATRNPEALDWFAAFAASRTR